MQHTLTISTPAQNDLYDITSQVEAIVAESGVQTGMVNVYVLGATAGVILFIRMYLVSILESIVATLHPIF